MRLTAEYACGHSINGPMLVDMTAFMREALHLRKREQDAEQAETAEQYKDEEVR